MKNLKFQKFKILSLILLISISLFTSCSKDEAADSLAESNMQSSQRSYEKQVTLTDSKGTSQAQVLIRTAREADLDQIARNIEISPIFEIKENRIQAIQGKPRAQSAAKPDYAGRVDFEILQSELPDNALGFTVKFKGDTGLEKMGTWLHTYAAANRRSASVEIYDGTIVTWNDYSLCSDINTYGQATPEITLSANGTLTFGTAPVDVGYNRISVEYEPGVDFYELEFKTEGTCDGLETCGDQETNTEQGPICCGLVSESPISTKAMQQISVFSRDELHGATLEATGMILKHQKILDELMNNDPEINEAIDLFFEQNSALLMNGFSNDQTIIREKHIKPAIALLQKIERKVDSKELQNYLQRIQNRVQKMNGMEFKSALKSLEK